MSHAIYVKITIPEENDYNLWDEYEIRIADKENSDEGEYNYLHEAILISAVEEYWSNIPALLKGYVAKTRKMEKVIEKIHPLGENGSFDHDDEVVVLIFLRTDKAKDFIVSDTNVLHPQEADEVEIKDYMDESS